MRRSSTKPERPRNESRDKSRDSVKEGEEPLEVKPKEMSACQKKSIALIDSWQWSIFMTVVTIYTLFFDDIRVACIPKSADDAFYTITCLCFALFLFEIILASIYQPKYWMSFFFWLDILATFSMVFDIGWIMDNLTNASQAGSLGSVAKSSRAARVTRIVRLVRLIRLVRIVKLYKQAKLVQQRREEAKLKALKAKKGLTDDDNDNNKKTKLQRQITSMKEAGLFAKQDDDVPVESKISKTLAEKSQKILIILILTILFLTPVFQVGTYFSADPAGEVGLAQLMNIYEKTTYVGTNQYVYNTTYATFVKSMKDYEYPIIELVVPVFGKTYYNTAIGDLRSDEYTEYQSSFDSKIIYSQKLYTQYES